jgi:eukaryotic-like serine/threonine-protein kinase
MALATGTRLDTFEIIGPLGAGGMGEVYRATDTKLGREVAIKTLPAALASDEDRLARFEREAKLLAALNHAHIASVYSLDEHEGTLYIAMELVEGETLEEKLKTGALSIEDSLRIALEIAEALEAAHEKGVVHRDLKPANVMLTAHGEVKVLDFGLAKAFSGDPNQATLAHSPALSAAMTQQGLIIGTAGYMSPEQASGQATDQRADIWAFGVVLYEMLAGLPLFSGESVPHILADVLRTEPDWGRLPKNVDPRLKRLLERCLKKKVRDRYHSMADVRVEIEDILSNPQAAAVAASSARPLWRRAILPAAMLLLGLASAYFFGREQPTAAPPEAAAALPISRYVITPPATAPLAAQVTGNIAISPDGKRIAYVAQKPDNGGTELYVRDLDALEARPLAGTEVRSGTPMMPFFAADGQSVGFSSGELGVLRAAIDGRPTTKLLDAPASQFLGASWSLDNRVTFSSALELLRAPAGSGSAPETLMPERQGTFIAAPVLLPRGRGVLYVTMDGSGTHVAALDLETGEEKTLIDGSTATYAETGHIVFARGTTLLAVPFDATELAITGDPVALVQGVRHPAETNAADFALSANGTLAYVPEPEDAVAGSAVVWVDRTGNVTGRVISDLVTNPRDPRLSPDGKRLLIVTGPPIDGDLWSYDLGGRPPIPLALPGNNLGPVWSPDGRQVAFAVVQGVVPDTFRLPADGSVLTPEQLPLPPSPGGTLPLAWSADGQLALLRRTSVTNYDIVATSMPAADELEPIVTTDYVEFDAALSPNGRWLAYVSDRTGQNEIWVQGYPDGVATRVSSNGGFEPLWSADGRELFYLQDDAMMAVVVDTEGEFSFNVPARLFSGPYELRPGLAARSYDVAQDGRFVLIQPSSSLTTAAPTSIVVVENWTEELKQRVRPRGQ